MRACETCERFLNIHHDKVRPFLPPSATPFLPKRYPELYNYQFSEGSRHHYCSAECLDESFMNTFQLTDATARSSSLKQALKQFQQLETEWSTFLPTVPPQMVLKAICMEIKATNPKMKEYHSRGGNKPIPRTPKQRLKVLEQFKPTRKNMADIGPLCEQLADYVNVVLLDYSPFHVETKLILDTVKRIYENHQTIVLNVREEKTLEKYLDHLYGEECESPSLSGGGEELSTQSSSPSSPKCAASLKNTMTPKVQDEKRRLLKQNMRGPTIQTSSSSSPPLQSNATTITNESSPLADLESEKQFLEASERELRSSGAGDLHLLWHPVVSSLFTAQSLINHSCLPNVYYSTINHETHQLDVIAARNILTGEEIAASYLDPSFLSLPTPARRGHLATTFGFTCECKACSSN